MTDSTITVVQKAPTGERYPDDCFDASIGRPIYYVFDERGHTLPGDWCTLRSAEVAADGRTVTLNVEAPEPIDREVARGQAGNRFALAPCSCRSATVHEGEPAPRDSVTADQLDATS